MKQLFSWATLFSLLTAILLTAGVIGGRVWYVSSRSVPSFTPAESTFVLTPPVQAVNGLLLQRNGNVQKEGRDDNDLRVLYATESAWVEGDRFVTPKGAQLVADFPQIVEVGIGDGSDVVLSNALTNGFLFRQAQGTVNYTLRQNQHAVSVRTLQTLVTLGEGSTRIVTDPVRKEIQIMVIEGTAQFAFIDAENNTQVYDLKSMQTAVIREATKTVKISDL